MNCPKRTSGMVKSDRESSVTKEVYRCSNSQCSTEYKYFTGTGQLVEVGTGGAGAAYGAGIALQYCVVSDPASVLQVKKLRMRQACLEAKGHDQVAMNYFGIKYEKY